VTWIEISIIASAAGLLSGVVMRRYRSARLLAVVFLCVLVLMLVIFGVELISDML
jgi:hypothetical protein